MGIIKKILKQDDKQDAVEMKKEKTSNVNDKDVLVSDKKVEPKKEEAKKEKKSKKKDDTDAYKILERPLVTEKATDLVMLNKYIFAVPRSATKAEISKKIINVYGVKPVKVNILNVSGKKVRFGRRFGKKKDWKKAIVTLHAEDKIEIYEGV
jgi:large subunit ribosomal protein L23